jgi:hypothetical protein
VSLLGRGVFTPASVRLRGAGCSRIGTIDQGAASKSGSAASFSPALVGDFFTYAFRASNGRSRNHRTYGRRPDSGAPRILQLSHHHAFGFVRDGRLPGSYFRLTSAAGVDDLELLNALSCLDPVRQLLVIADEQWTPSSFSPIAATIRSVAAYDVFLQALERLIPSRLRPQMPVFAAMQRFIISGMLFSIVLTAFSSGRPYISIYAI